MNVWPECSSTLILLIVDIDYLVTVH
uniref:Uncharacterized protein n=1 Tax=Rhizophora mucronata TaxID=61149 RepID=A0A2P2N4Y2_RHIMU